jgi:predicted acyltransferase
VRELARGYEVMESAASSDARSWLYAVGVAFVLWLVLVWYFPAT